MEVFEFVLQESQGSWESCRNPHFLRSISHVRSLPTEVISRPRFYRWQWPGRSLDRTPTPRPLVVGRAWWRKRAASHWALNTLKFQPKRTEPCSEISFFLVRGFRQIALIQLGLSTSTEKMSLTSHMDRLLSFGPPSHAHLDSTLDESRVSCHHIRMKHHGKMNFFGVTGNLEPKTHRLRINGTCSDLITKDNYSSIPIFCRRSCWSTTAGKPVDVEEKTDLRKNDER